MLQKNSTEKPKLCAKLHNNLRYEIHIIPAMNNFKVKTESWLPEQEKDLYYELT